MSATAQQDHAGTKLSELARQLGEKAREYEDLVRGQKTNEDRRMIETLKSFDLTVNHPEKVATTLRSIASLVDELPEAVSAASAARSQGEAHGLLESIAQIVGRVVEQV